MTWASDRVLPLTNPIIIKTFNHGLFTGNLSLDRNKSDTVNGTLKWGEIVILLLFCLWWVFRIIWMFIWSYLKFSKSELKKKTWMSLFSACHAATFSCTRSMNNLLVCHTIVSNGPVLDLYCVTLLLVIDSGSAALLIRRRLCKGTPVLLISFWNTWRTKSFKF